MNIIAQTAPLELPSFWQGVTVATVGGVVVLVLVTGAMLVAMQRIRSAVAKEVKHEINADEKGTNPQPFLVKYTPGYVTADHHEKEIAEIKEELKRHASRRAEIYAEQKQLAVQLADVRAKAELTHAQLQNIDTKVDRILASLPRAK